MFLNGNFPNISSRFCGFGLFFCWLLWGVLFPFFHKVGSYFSLSRKSVHADLVNKMVLFIFFSGRSQKNKNRNIEKYTKTKIFGNIRTCGIVIPYVTSSGSGNVPR